MDSQKNSKKERVGLVVNGEWGLFFSFFFLPRTKSEQKHSKPAVKIHPWQREEHIRGNLEEKTISANVDWWEENVTEGTWSDLSLPWTFTLFLPLAKNTIYWILTAERLDGRKRTVWLTVKDVSSFVSLNKPLCLAQIMSGLALHHSTFHGGLTLN